jgi:hypothetical protein
MTDVHPMLAIEVTRDPATARGRPRRPAAEELHVAQAVLAELGDPEAAEPNPANPV